MSAASPQAPNAPALTTGSPWGNQEAVSSPKLQEILDEQLAHQLNELELEQVTMALLAEVDAADAQWEELEYSTSDFSDDDEVGSREVTEADDKDESEAEADHLHDDHDDYDMYDTYDGADEAGEEFLTRNRSTRGMGSRRRDDATSQLKVTGNFDERTLFVLRKLATRGVLNAVDSRIHSSSTAMVYHGTNVVPVEDSDETTTIHYAVKILKSSSIDHGAQKTAESLQRSNRPANEEMMWMSVRRQLKVQMDREYTALARAVASGVRAPAPNRCWEHVLVMEFVGNGTKAAPRLRDVTLNKGQLAQGFVDLLVGMRAMYQQAKLVHGGLSDYSILYHNDACWITDFSSAIDTNHAEHTMALEQDIAFVHSFFASNGMPRATKHNVGMLNESAMRQVVTEDTPNKVLSAFPWLKPYLYKKK